MTAVAEQPPSDRHRAESDPYASTPTRFTVFLRTFLPWQIWRFVRINLKMVGIVRHRRAVPMKER